MVIRLEIKISRLTDNLFSFINDVHRLCAGKKNFIFSFKHGNKLYLDTCKGFQDDLYICLENTEDAKFLVATLNYSIALHAKLQLSIDGLVLRFDISSNDEVMQKIKLFADSLETKYTIC